MSSRAPSNENIGFHDPCAQKNAIKQLLSGADDLFTAKGIHSSPSDLHFAGLEALTFPSLILIFAFFSMRRRSFCTKRISTQPARNARTFVPLWKVFSCVGAEIVWSSCTTFKGSDRHNLTVGSRKEIAEGKRV